MVTLPSAEQFGLCDRTILITGGAGFIGRHLVASLAPANDVHVLDDCSTGDPTTLHPAASLRQGDVRNPESYTEFGADLDLIVHLAGLVSVDRSIEVPRETEQANAAGTLEVLEAARRSDASVVTASSAAVYGEPSAVPVTESQPKTPSSPYGAEKLSGDRYMRLYADLYDLDTVALRYFNVYGPGGIGTDYSGVIDAFLTRARRNEELPVHGDGTQTRDFVHVSDVVQANLLAAVTEQTGDAYNVGTGKSVTINRLAELIVDVTDSSSDIVHTEPRAGDIDESEANIERARDQLGYEPRTTLRDGLEALVHDAT